MVAVHAVTADHDQGAAGFRRGHHRAGSAVVRLRGAGIARAGRTVWSGVDVEAEAGEFVAVLGPNGTGKSTLLSVVLGLLPVSTGAATVFGEPPGRHNRAIGYLPQRRNFDGSQRIRGVDVVRLGIDGDRWGLTLRPSRRRATAARVGQLVEMVDATAYAHRAIGELSGGEQQRLLIAQAMASSPRLLLLDEPLDSLDLPNQAAVAATLSRICREHNVTVMIVAHDVNPLLPYLDTVLYLGRGTAVSGAPAQVMTTATLSALYAAPVEVIACADGRLAVIGQPEAPSQHGHRHSH